MRYVKAVVVSSSLTLPKFYMAWIAQFGRAQKKVSLDINSYSNFLMLWEPGVVGSNPAPRLHIGRWSSGKDGRAIYVSLE